MIIPITFRCPRNESDLKTRLTERSASSRLRAAVLALLAFSAAAALVLTSGAAADAAPPAAQVTASASATGVALGKSVALSGSVRVSGRGAVDTVRIVGMPSGRTNWVLLGTTRSAGDGTWAFAFTPTTSYKTKAEVLPSSAHGAGASGYVSVAVQAQIYSVVPGARSSAVAGGEKTMTAAVYAQLAGQRVKLVVLRRGVWTDSTVSRVAADGTVVLSYRVASGDTAFRIYLPASAGLIAKLGPVQQLTTVASVDALSATTSCVGAGGLPAPGACVNHELDGLALPTTEAAGLAADTGGSYAKACWAAVGTALVPTCAFGSTKPDAYRVALVGDSHAAGYVTGIRDRLSDRGWHLDTYLGVTCRWLAQPAGDVCAPRSDDIGRRLSAGDYDMVVVAGLRQPRSAAGDAGAAATAEGYRKAWAPLLAAGTRVVAIADQPYLTDGLVACTTTGGATAAAKCSAPRSFATGGIDPLVAAVGASPGASLVDLTSHYCTADTCPLVIGGVIVFRDRHHITGTWSATLGPPLLTALDQVRREARP